MDQFLKEVPLEKQERIKGLKYIITERHTQIKINHEFLDKIFTFIPPDESTLVEYFGHQRSDIVTSYANENKINYLLLMAEDKLIFQKVVDELLAEY